MSPLAPDPAARVIVGLGNPGEQYAGTRHNVGFDVLDRLLSLGQVLERYATPEAEWIRLDLLECDVAPFWLCRPLAYMNRSGLAVAMAVKRLSLPLDRLLVVVDDFALPLGSWRFRQRGTAGGHNGLRSVEQELASQAYPRLRVGIGPKNANLPEDIISFVLGRFEESEAAEWEKAIQTAAAGVCDWLTMGLVFCQNKYNNLDAIEIACKKEELP